MDNSRNSRSLLYYLTRCIGEGGRQRLARVLASIRADTAPFSLRECLSPTDLVMVLPENLVEALLQMRNVVSIAASMPRTSITLIGQSAVVPYFAGLQGVSSVLDYELEDRYLFSKPLATITEMLARGGQDVCLMLEREPDPALLYLAARCGAKLRVGYDDAGVYPYLNVHLRGSGNRPHREEQNLLMAETIGVRPLKQIRWRVPQKTKTEISHLLSECGIQDDSSSLVGLDATYLFGLGGAEGVNALLERLRTCRELTLYLYADAHPSPVFQEWLRRTGLPVLLDLSVPRTVALVSRSMAILSGKSALFYLARLVGTHAVGLFRREEVRSYGGQSPGTTAIPFAAASDHDAITRACEVVTSLLSVSSQPSGRSRKK